MHEYNDIFQKKYNDIQNSMLTNTNVHSNITHTNTLTYPKFERRGHCYLQVDRAVYLHTLTSYHYAVNAIIYTVSEDLF